MKMYVVVVITWAILQCSPWTTDAISIDLKTANKGQYVSFLERIRTAVKDPSLKYGGTDIAVIRDYDNDQFLRIKLQLGSQGTVSLGLRRKNLYVVAYVAKNNAGVYRAYYIKNEITPAQLQVLFPEAPVGNNQQMITEYNERYGSLEHAAGIPPHETRKEFGLGWEKLVRLTEAVNGKARVVKNEARFLLVAIQMVSEATRLKYIQNLVFNTFPKDIKYDNKVIQFQTNWDVISSKIYLKAINGAFKKEDQFDIGFGKITHVRQLYMGLLKYQGKNRVSIQANNSTDYQGSAVL